MVVEARPDNTIARPRPHFQQPSTFSGTFPDGWLFAFFPDEHSQLVHELDGETLSDSQTSPTDILDRKEDIEKKTVLQLGADAVPSARLRCVFSSWIFVLAPRTFSTLATLRHIFRRRYTDTTTFIPLPPRMPESIFGTT